eukprot:TRINITY_DN6655_c0_g1_i1.p1 TRINITY_DN6655_c0_g1~~TRINITY_DN6655_c0_g1_i1.p1  ORF type:complete len:460 (+),score=98.21 TRINITY_DN6655_c0_g1_i1:157-1536(+)
MPGMSMIDRVAEIRSPRSTRKSVGVSHSPRSAHGLAVMTKQADQRMTWLLTQLAEVQMQLDELPVHREAEFARLDAEVKVKVDELTTLLQDELAKIAIENQLDMHDLRSIEVPLCDQLFETEERIRRRVIQIQEIQTAMRDQNSLFDIPLTPRSQRRRDRQVSERESGLSPLPADTAPVFDSFKVTTPRRRPLVREDNISDAEWVLIQKRMEIVELEEDLAQLTERLKLAQQELAKEMHNAVQDSLHKKRMAHQNKYSALKTMFALKDQMIAQKHADIDRTRDALQLATQLEEAIDRVCLLWTAAAGFAGEWKDSNCNLLVQFSPGCLQIEGSQLLSEQLRSLLNESQMAPPTAHVALVGSKSFDPAQTKVVESVVCEDSMGFMLVTPLGQQRWQLRADGKTIHGVVTSPDRRVSTRVLVPSDGHRHTQVLASHNSAPVPRRKAAARAARPQYASYQQA